MTHEEKKRKIREIAREYEAKRRELGLKAPVISRGPVFYLAVIVGLALVGGAVLQAAGKGGGRRMGDARLLHARQSVAALAEALGRYKFHCGVYPGAEDGGIEALSRKESRHAGWIGPYATKIVPDPWKRPYVYEPPKAPDAEPTVLSLGADGVRGTADDVLPDPALFSKPFRDTGWTNDWVHFSRRGIIVVPKKDLKKQD